MIRAVRESFQNNARPTFKGKFYEFTLMTPLFNGGPIEHPQIPIYIAGVNEYMCRFAGEERAALKGLVKQQIAFYASTPAYRPVLEAHGWGETQAKLNDKARSGDWGGMADLITDEMLDVYATTGRWDEIASKLQKKYDGILDRLSFYVPYRKGERVERWRDVIRAFNG